MAPKEDLEQLIRDSYEIIHENQQIIQESPDLPAQRKRAKRQIEQQRGLIYGYLTEYVPLCLTLKAQIPDDILQILAPFPNLIDKITELADNEQVLETATRELLEQIERAEKNRQAFAQVADQRDYGREIAELRQLVEKYQADLANLRFLRHDRPACVLDLEIYVSEVTQEFEEWERKYTSLRLTHELRLATWYGETAQLKHTDKPKEMFVREAVEQNDRLIILGDPGAGKTTSLKRMALEYAQQAVESISEPGRQAEVIVPLFVELGRYTDRVTLGLARHRYEDILWLLGEALQATCGARQPEITQEDVRLALSTYRFVLFFDGLNEVAEEQRGKCTQAIKAFVKQYESHRYVITSRKHGYVPSLGYETLEILELSLEEISQYVARYLDEEQAQKLVDELSPRLRRLAQNPLVLRIMIDVFQVKGHLPRSRGKLLDQFIRLTLQRDMLERSESLHYSEPEDINLKIDLCVYVGYWMQTGGQYIAESEAVQLITKELDRLGRTDVQVSEIIHDLCYSHILEQAGHWRLRFWHQTIQEYFAAVHICEEWRQSLDLTGAQRSRAKRAIARYVRDTIWHETFQAVQ